MSYSLYINNIEIELYDNDEIIPLTKQVNDIASLSNRQTNFTKSFKVPKTAKNIRTFKNLSIVGNDSNIPYQKNTADYIDNDNGQHLIYKGWAVINSSDDDNYNLNIYDGIIDLFKAIENKKLSDLNLSLLNHDKTTASVIETWNDLLPYKYILADYNGKAIYDTDKINIDYLVPSVRCSFLMEKIQEYIGFDFQGLVFSNPDYLNWFLTYPKSTPTENVKTLIYEDSDFKSYPLDNSSDQYYVFDQSKIIGNDLVVENGLLKILINLGLSIIYNAGVGHTWTETVYDPGDPPNQIPSSSTDVNFSYVSWATFGTNSWLVLGDGIENTAIANSNSVASMSFNTNFSFPSGSFNQQSTVDFYFLKIYKNSLGTINFQNELSGFSIKEFLNEFIIKFGLTIFPDKYKNIYYFKYLKEILNKENAIDWSSKFSAMISEKYIFGGYAQNNFFKHNYNEPDADYNDGFITINNVNLPDLKSIIKSKVYTPELNTNNILGFVSKVYKFWEKEIDDQSNVKYKDLQNHFYFIRNQNIQLNRIIGSLVLGTQQNISNAPIESYFGLKYSEIIFKYYSDYFKILNNSKVVKAEIFLNFFDVSDVDFSRLIYLEEYSSYFILNKIIAFKKNKVTTCEFIKIKL